MEASLSTIANAPDLAAIERALIGGDLEPLSVDQRLSYYRALCDSLGLNQLSKPFAYIKLNGKLVLYATKDCTDQLRSIRQVSVTDLEVREVAGLFVAVAKGSDSSGRCDMATGAVSCDKLAGEARANAMMKAETKAKRRLTLSLCGLGIIDESEIETAPGARVVEAQSVPVPALPARAEVAHPAGQPYRLPNGRPDSAGIGSALISAMNLIDLKSIWEAASPIIAEIEDVKKINELNAIKDGKKVELVKANA